MLLADPWIKGRDVSNGRRALVVDDDPTARLMLKSLLSRSGYDVTLAVNGVEALERFAQVMPDIVFLDMRMPQMDGLQAAARIKELSPNEFVPVIFVTGASETEDLVRGIEAGADDFMTKPFDQRVLAAKIRAMERIRDLHRSAARLHAQAQADWEVAQSLLSEVVMGSNPRPPALHVDLVPTANFSGDIFLAEHCPSGDLNLLLGDFTGHGLAAAVAALPTAETFRSMTAKGFAPNQILIEINRKLRAQLPTGKFLAAVFIQVSRSLERVWAINCGMPDVLLCSDKGIRARIASSTLPLAVLREPDLGDGLRPYPIEPGERLILASDGVHEAANSAGEQFGRARLESAATVAAAGESASVRIKAELDAFRGRQPITDDATLVEAVLVPELFAAYQPPALGWARPGAPASASGQWRMALDLHADALRVSDPVPMILSQLREIPGINEHLSVLYTVLSELYSNALEHGVLGLSSSLKNEPEGFERYLAARERELAALREGWVRISAVCAQWPGGGQLVFRVEDSGAGFDWRARPADAPHDPHGRGLNLVRGLCRTVSFEGEGNQVRATYAWGAGRREDAAA
jgi:two-component system, HptB-dependent secretion and biofilm response regulator